MSQQPESEQLTPSFTDLTDKIIDTGTNFSLLSTGISAVYEGFSMVGGAVSLFGSGLTGMFSLFQGGIGLVTGFFDTLFGAAQSYHNGAGREMFEANQAIIGQFGDLAANEGAQVKDMAKDITSANSALAGAGSSLYATIGNSASSSSPNIRPLSNELSTSRTTHKDPVVMWTHRQT